MRFADIIGNDEVKKALTAMADSGKLAHAMLFYENEGCGALPLVLAYIQYLGCRNRHDGDSCGVCPACNRMSKLIHPDTHFVFPVNAGTKVSASSKPTSESYMQYWRELVVSNPYFLESQLYDALGIEGKAGNIAVAEAKSILDKLSLTPVENGYKTVVMWLPERMNAEAANRLLKIVEEPPEKTLFLFVTHAPEKVLQTISSRCQSVRILPLSKDGVRTALEDRFGISHDMAVAYANVSGGSIGAALQGAGGNDGHEVFLDMFSDLMNAVAAKDLLGALETSERLSALDSREKQKAFCNFAGDCIRKIYMIQQNMVPIANLLPQEEAFFLSVAAKCGPHFCEKSIVQIDRSAALLERNVNAKIVFCDLADRMFLSI